MGLIIIIFNLYDVRYHIRKNRYQIRVSAFFKKNMREKRNFAFNAFVTLGFLIYLSKGNKYFELHDAYCESDI